MGPVFKAVPLLFISFFVFIMINFHFSVCRTIVQALTGSLGLKLCHFLLLLWLWYLLVIGPDPVQCINFVCLMEIQFEFD